MLPGQDLKAALAIYNAEVARGIVHTAAWDEQMARAQAEYDDMVAAEATRAASETISRLCAEIGSSPKGDDFVVSRVQLGDICGMSGLRVP